MNPLLRFSALVVAVLIGYAAGKQATVLINRSFHTGIPVGGK